MMNKQQLYDWVDQLMFFEVFEELDNFPIQSNYKPLFETLRQEFISGTKTVDFINRLKSFISSLRDKTGQDSLNLYVITATKAEVEQNGKKYKVKMPLERYHETDLEEWQPFGQESVRKLLADYEERKGFSLDFRPSSSFSCTKSQTRDWIRENRKNMVLWADLLALNENNEDFVRYFDDGEIGGLLVSLCPSDPENVQKHIRNQTQKVFKNRKDDFENYTKENTNIGLGIPNKEWLFRILTNIAVLHLKINRISEKEDKKGIRNDKF